jgi:2-hydroxychromene-2-carboxylate isomerase
MSTLLMNSFIFEMIYCKRLAKSAPKAIANSGDICTNHRTSATDALVWHNQQDSSVHDTAAGYMTQVIEYFFSITSPWAYLGSERLIALAQRAQVRIKPLLITSVDENGWIPMKKKPPVRQRYVQSEIGRWSRHLGVPLQQDNRSNLKDATPAAMMVVAADAAGEECLPLAVARQRAHWESAADIGDPEIRRTIADAAEYNGQRLLDSETEPAVTRLWQENRTRAIGSGIFGSPTYVFDGEMYWGQDRLDFLERHIVTGSPV